MSVQEYERIFREADVDNNGKLSVDELTAQMRKKGFRGSDRDIRVSGQFAITTVTTTTAATATTTTTATITN